MSALMSSCVVVVVAMVAAPSVTVLLAGRVVTGLGAALVMPATLSLLMQVTPPERKPRAIATWTGATGAADAFDDAAFARTATASTARITSRS
jgi:predicted MFS family arabinose efflux permease